MVVDSGGNVIVLVGEFIYRENDNMEKEKNKERVTKEGFGKSVEMSKGFESDGEKREVPKKQESAKKVEQVENVFKVTTVIAKPFHGVCWWLSQATKMV